VAVAPFGREGGALQTSPRIESHTHPGRPAATVEAANQDELGGERPTDVEHQPFGEQQLRAAGQPHCLEHGRTVPVRALDTFSCLGSD
jgi:hypothetical protein